MTTKCYTPATGYVLEELDDFLQSLKLEYDNGITYTIIKWDDDGIAATGSLDGRVLKCVAVRPDLRGTTLLQEVVKELIEEAHAQGYEHVLLVTRPIHEERFQDMGFYTVEETDRLLLMEDRPDGLNEWLETVPAAGDGIKGVIIANFDPITNGHMYLIQKAQLLCDKLYLFVLSDERGAIPAKDRLEMVKAAVAHIPNIIVCPAGDYQVSNATFPAYSLPDREAINRLSCELDLKLFACKIAAPLGISHRFVGQEPYSPLTGKYNLYMKEILPQYGVSLVEFSRLRANDKGFFNSFAVRRLWDEKDFEALAELVPHSTLEYMKNHRPVATR